ncbi:MAG: hypothetical protein KIS96_14250 [Bauldia sp.]|nr:hypothetical protein [Bauldia sp.]
MGFLTGWATRSARSTVKRGLSSASDDELLRQLRTLNRAFRMTYKPKEQGEIERVRVRILMELDRRNIPVPTEDRNDPE